jgi:hypothetical protein
MAEAPLAGRDGLFKRERVVFDQQPAGVPVGALPSRKGHAAGADLGTEPEVKVVKAADGTVQQIIVRCACGREITLHCEYFGRGDENAKQTA